MRRNKRDFRGFQTSTGHRLGIASVPAFLFSKGIKYSFFYFSMLLR